MGGAWQGLPHAQEAAGIPVGPVGFGICMDINPREFKAPFDAYEFASHHQQAGSRLIVFCSAWCANHPDDPPQSCTRKADEQVSCDTLDYWLRRLQPLWGSDVHFVCADRVGEEELSLLGRFPNDVRRNRFCGCSCVISLSNRIVLGALGPSEEGVLVVDIPVIGAAQAVPPLTARVVQRQASRTHPVMAGCDDQNLTQFIAERSPEAHATV
eukprot:CAMPEP_0179145928 /NCGR_PEP_ID=MMETSP0796-20121207/70440_1 /TAXON_ID=73915 /ORGANISM="Pyrodinium bahamense, Strain pbaha01" /LENGTH=211 /DNA_ID=CAMNT_0020846369 /DNA_START=45 /DNA_END=680 /DNA_ORIENTATION=-